MYLLLKNVPYKLTTIFFYLFFLNFYFFATKLGGKIPKSNFDAYFFDQMGWLVEQAGFAMAMAYMGKMKDTFKKEPRHFEKTAPKKGCPACGFATRADRVTGM